MAGPPAGVVSEILETPLCICREGENMRKNGGVPWNCENVYMQIIRASDDGR